MASALSASGAITLSTRRRWVVPLLLLAPTLVVMAYAFVAPLITFFEYSFYRFRRGRLEQVFTLDTYSRFLFDEYYHLIIYDTLRMATLVTVLSLIIGYPLAYGIARCPPRMRCPRCQSSRARNCRKIRRPSPAPRSRGSTCRRSCCAPAAPPAARSK